MRGKKTDPLFISQFIQESVQQGNETPDQIVQRAKKMIEVIDGEIRDIETKKITRSKLLDVITSFEKQSKDRAEEAKLLPLFNLEYPDVCKCLCEAIQKQPISVDPKLYDSKNIFVIKQLLARKIIVRVEDKIVCGERFDEYMKLILRR